MGTEQENKNLQILQESLAGALKEVFGEYTESQRFLDLKRIPLICKDISNIYKILEDIKKVVDNDNKDDDHEKRIRKMESKIAYYTGASGVLGALAMWALSHFVK